jgi:hypothetical protein
MAEEGPIIKGLIFLGDKLFSLADVFRRSEREKKDRVAEYCEKIAKVLSHAYDELERGHIPHGLCSEMDRYIHDLKTVLQNTLPRDEYDDLNSALQIAYKVEHIDRELPNPPRLGTKYAELDIAAGKFRAIANRIRAT